MECDVLIVYEHRVRELENACLLAVELEERGFSVQIRHIESLKKYFIRANVVVTPHLYNNIHILVHAKNFWKSNKNLISLQCEQILEASIDEDNVHNPKEEAIFAQHIAWGEAQKVRYLKCGISTDHIHVTGNIAMDFVSSHFDDYYMSRTDIATRYFLDNNKKWLLFMSSFSYTDRTEDELKAFEKTFPPTRLMASISNETRSILINWFIKICKDFPALEIIYRPHPHEKNIDDFVRISKLYTNFHVIGDYSVRQWVKVSDLVYTWYSSAIADACFAKKTCGILRPVPIPFELEVEIMEGAKFITSYDTFVNSIVSGNSEFSIDMDRIHYYYGGNENGQMAYKEIADLCVKMMNSELGYNYHYKGSRFNILNDNGVKPFLKTLIWHFICDISDKVRLSRFIPHMFFTDTLLSFEKENYHISKEIKELKRRIKPIIKRINKR